MKYPLTPLDLCLIRSNPWGPFSKYFISPLEEVFSVVNAQGEPVLSQLSGPKEECERLAEIVLGKNLTDQPHWQIVPMTIDLRVIDATRIADDIAELLTAVHLSGIWDP